MTRRLASLLAVILAALLMFSCMIMPKPAFAEGLEGIGAMNVDIDIRPDVATFSQGRLESITSPSR